MNIHAAFTVLHALQTCYVLENVTLAHCSQASDSDSQQEAENALVYLSSTHSDSTSRYSR